MAISVHCVPLAHVKERDYRSSLGYHNSYIHVSAAVSLMSQNDITLENIPVLVCMMLHLVFLYKQTHFLLWPSQIKRIFLLQAFSAFYFVMNFLNLTSESKPLALNKVTSTIESFCARPWQEVSRACCSRLRLLILFCRTNGWG